MTDPKQFSRTTSKPFKLSQDNAVYKDGLPTSIRVFAPGHIIDTRGETAIYSTKNASSIMEANNRRDKRVPMDVAHGMINPNAPPEMHEAYVWSDMRCDATGIWIDNLKFRPKFEAKFREGAFAYISPTFIVDKKTREITDLITVSWTNIPATLDAEPLAADKSSDESSEDKNSTSSSKAILTEKNTMAKATKATPEDLELVKREDEEASKDEPEKEAPAAAEEKPEEEKDYSTIDVEGLSMEERGALCHELLDKLADMKAASKAPEGEEPKDDEDEEEAKRDIVTSLFNERFVKHADLLALRTMKLGALVKQDRKLRSNSAGSREAVVRAKQAAKVEKTYTNAMSEKLEAAGKVDLGANDEQIEKYLAKFGKSYEGLGLQRSKGTIFGANITSSAKKNITAAASEGKN